LVAISSPLEPRGHDCRDGQTTQVAAAAPALRLLPSPAMKWLACSLLAVFAFHAGAVRAERQVAITIDDLPRGGDTTTERDLATVRAMTAKLLGPFRDERIPVIGFVNEGRPVDFGPHGLREILELWLDAGADLGNHSYSHLNINNVALDEYTADITRGEPLVRAALAARGRKLEYFRHPFLFTGPTPEIKAGLQAFLDGAGYVVAPVTLDDADYMYAALYMQPEHRERALREYLPYMESVIAFFETRSVEVAGREFPQILLIHANQLNADVMPELLEMFRRRGYTFVTLARALEDDAYRLPDGYAGRGGFSWIHRWSRTKGMPGKTEPDPPPWVPAAFAEK
jgi:peptidoglycan/xylan/chitin deacetylase (PgdA/CDA1 family)